MGILIQPQQESQNHKLLNITEVNLTGDLNDMQIKNKNKKEVETIIHLLLRGYFCSYICLCGLIFEFEIQSCKPNAFHFS